MPSARPKLTAALILLSFLAVAAVQTWPLPLHLGTHLTADPGGDTGVYIWNTWVFSHELLVERSSPFDTNMILSLGGTADLSLHNYTVFANLLSLGLQPWLGVVAAFNVVYLVNFALAGLGTFLLVRRLPQTAAAGPAAAWLAAVLFACSPFLVARGNGHFSVAAAAALPFFVLTFTRALDSRKLLDAAKAGMCLAWAGYSEAYYAIYCVLLGVAIVAARSVEVRRSPVSGVRPLLKGLDIVAALVATAVVLIHGFGGGLLTLGSVSVSMRTLYTPMLVLTALVAVRMYLTLRPRARWIEMDVRSLVPPGLVMCGVATLLLAPQILAVAVRASEGRLVTAPVPWRSSAPGVDLAALLLPNPNHPLTPATLVEWVHGLPGESVASLPWVALLTVLAGWRWAGCKLDRTWLAIGLTFLWLSLGPFVRVAGVETFIPTPWTFARYLPLIGEARMPARMSVLVVLALSVLFASAWAALRLRSRALAAAVAGALCFELIAAPRTLHSADVPAIFQTVTSDPRDVRVLLVPTGIKDGLDTFGSFSAAALFYQTAHQKPLVAGYLSRISDQRKDLYTGHPVLGPLIDESSGRIATDQQRQQAYENADAFITGNRVGWVVIDEASASASLQAFVIDVLGLTLQERRGSFALYAPSRAID